MIEIIKLILGGIAAFLAIIVWNKTRDSSWMAIVGGIIISYAQTVYNLLIHLGILSVDRLAVFGIPLTSLIFTVGPLCLIILGLILMIKKHS